MNLYLLRAYLDLQLVLFDIPPLCDAVLRLRKIRKIKKVKAKNKEQDYPAVVSRCCVKDYHYTCNNPFKSYYGKTKHPNNKSYITSQMVSEMNKIGGIGNKSKSGICPFIIGKCAEQHAAELLLRENKSCKLNNILFSTPIRPRTNEPRAFCENCKQLFTL